ncbi:cytochrome ubiquinol oxidase subunit I [uncultured Umboniibacter sp.]|uniref:cytochrome ubiquinol oxidase subunit I n=1 Tax=uncultured Umboniibacter sp. TaxID=1798917 RepID=UPI00261B8181|nr:cytochrome ubiquinol oxidase subunit I [uncultured Umboniibacter sp.]
MFDTLDPVLLARLQFAFTVSFHIIFPAFTIGLASWLAVVEWRWLRTGDKTYEQVYRMWVKIFAVCFGMGVVSGVVMSYQFGTNWSLFSDRVGNVIGPLLGYEVLTAFFLEASFLGIMLFGWGRVSKKMHFASTCIVAVGTIISAFWILAANSWMQTPQGFEIGQDGLLYPTSWTEIIFNPSFPPRFVHMVTAAYLTTAFVVGGVGAYYLWREKYLKHAKIMFGMAMLMAIFVAPLQLIIGHWHGENTMQYQPIKVAAMEGNWDRGTNKPLYLFGIPNEETETTDYGITLPGAASWILTGSTDGEIPGLKDVAKEDRPPVGIVFWSFRVMVGVGLGMILTGAIAICLYFRKRLFDTRYFQWWCMAMTPAGFIAVLAGWFVTEVGRQPWTAYGVIRTAESISPVIAEQVLVTLVGFVVVYTFVFGAGSYYIVKLIRTGPKIIDEGEEFYSLRMDASVTKRVTGGGTK